MKKYALVLALIPVQASFALAHWYFAAITAVDADKGTITYTITTGKSKDTQVTAKVTRDCVIKDGYYRLGKPATAKEGSDIPKGLRDRVFQKTSTEQPLRVNVFTADVDDPASGVQRGDVRKILVNPPAK